MASLKYGYFMKSAVTLLVIFFLVIEQRASLRASCTCTLYDLSFRDSGWINSRAITRYRDAPT